MNEWKIPSPFCLRLFSAPRALRGVGKMEQSLLNVFAQLRTNNYHPDISIQIKWNRVYSTSKNHWLMFVFMSIEIFLSRNRKLLFRLRLYLNTLADSSAVLKSKLKFLLIGNWGRPLWKNQLFFCMTAFFITVGLIRRQFVLAWRNYSLLLFPEVLLKPLEKLIVRLAPELWLVKEWSRAY